MSKTIKGINLEIGGNTTGLNKALSTSNTSIGALNRELKTVNAQLKFDPQNVTLLSQKQDILTKSIQDTTKKLETLKTAEEGVDQAFANNEMSVEAYRQFKREIVATENALESLKKQKSSPEEIAKSTTTLKERLTQVKDELEPLKPAFEAVGKVGKGAFDVVKTSAEITGKAFKAYVTTATAAGAALVTVATSGAMQLEATQAKYETVFDGFTDQAQGFIDQFQELTPASESATRSMASGFQDLLVPMGFAREKATELTGETMQIVGALTNFNSATETAESVSEKFNAALTGEYSSLKSLGIQVSDEIVRQRAYDLGLSASTKEVDSQAKAQALLSLAYEQSGDALAAYNVDSLDTTTKFQLLSSQIKDSASTLGMSFLPAINDLANVGLNKLPTVTDAFNNIFTGVNVAKNGQSITNDIIDIINSILPTIETQVPVFLTGFNTIITSLLNATVATLPALIDTLLPALFTGFNGLVLALVALLPSLVPIIVDGGVTLLQGLLDSVNLIIPELVAVLPSIVDSIADTLINNIPTIINSGIALLVALVQGLPSIITGIVIVLPSIITSIVTALISNQPIIMQAGITLMTAIIDDLPAIINAIVAELPTIISSIIASIIGMKGLLIQAGFDLFVSLIANLPSILVEVASVCPMIIEGIVNGFNAGFGTITDVGSNLVKGLWQGMQDAGTWLKNQIVDWGSKIIKNIQGVFGIKSPATKIRDLVGIYITQGLGVGMVKGIASLITPIKTIGKTVTNLLYDAVPTTFDLDTGLNLQSKIIKIDTLGTNINSGEAQSQGGNIIQYNTYNSPQALSPSESARLTKLATRRAILAG